MKHPPEASAEGRGRIVGITDGVFAIALTLMLGVTLFASWRYADTSGFVAEDVDAETRRTVYLRIVKAQILWAIGATLCLINPLLSIGFILVVQLIYAAALRSSLLRNVIG